MSAVILQFVRMANKRTSPPLPNRLRELREAAGLTQVQLGDLIGVQNHQISRFETGDREMDVPWMKRLAKALGVAPGDLFSLEDQGLTEDERLVLSAMRHDDFTREMIVAPARVAMRQTVPLPVPVGPAANDQQG